MGEVTTLKVPGEYMDLFTIAAVAEVALDAGGVEESAAELDKRILDPSRPRSPEQIVDLRAAAKYLQDTVEIVEQLLDASIWASREVRADAAALAHTAETMARDVVGPRIASEVRTGPYDEESTAKIGELTSALTWAAGEADRLHGVSVEQQKKTAKAGA